jgi:hypothetical protein
MRKVILTLGLAVGVLAVVVGIWGLAATPYDHLLPAPYRVVGFGASGMMGTLVLLVVAFAHGTRAGDVD